jgi:hypothetical protein
MDFAFLILYLCYNDENCSSLSIFGSCLLPFALLVLTMALFFLNGIVFSCSLSLFVQTKNLGAYGLYILPCFRI